MALTDSIVRILTPGGQTAGTGFYIDARRILTCSHVILSEQEQKHRSPEDGRIVRVFPVGGDEEFETRLLLRYWRPFAEGDIAVLELLGEVPASLRPLKLAELPNGHGETPIQTYGFPKVRSFKGANGGGQVFHQRIRAEEGNYDLLQLRGCTEITRGFSGGPVLDAQGQAIGMVSWITVPDEFERLQETAFAIPAERIAEVLGISTLSDDPPIAYNLRSGSRLRYQELRGPGGRFEHLDISEVLLTSARSQFIETDVKLGEERLGRRESVEKLWAMNPPHSIVLGDGGMGKTVSLLRLWERFLEDEQGPIPIFVQLNEFNQATQRDKENWLIWYIACYYLEGEYPLKDETERQIWNWLRTDWDRPYPKLILLLDGFNEISVDTIPLINELQQGWRRKAKGIQILLSSRYEINFKWAEDFQKLELQPLDEARAETYLQALGLPWPGPEQPDLRRLICNPMMLTLYAATSEFMRQEKGRADGFKPNASTGELIWNFIHAQTLKFEALHSIDEEQIHLYRWLIWHLLPWIGYEMEQRGLFSLTEEELLKLIQAYPAIIAPEDRWAYKKLFKDADRQWRSLGDDIPEAQAWTYYDTLTQTLRLFRPEGEDLAFFHQNFRDFFAALHLRNNLMLDVDRKRPPGLLIPRALSIYLRRMLGEIEGEHHNAARLEGRRWAIAHQQPTLLTRALDGCRGLHGPQRPGLAVFNLLELIHEVRGEWTGLDLRGLDLYGIPLNHRIIRYP